MISQDGLVGGAMGAVIGLPLLAWFYKRVFTKVAFEDTSKTATDAQRSVIEMLKTEVERMSKINGDLTKAINEMQVENIKIHIKFRQEITQLHETISGLTDRLNAISRRKEVG